MSVDHDFPFYNGRPVAISALGWTVVLAGVAAAFALLIAWPAQSLTTQAGAACAFAIIPLVALAAVAGNHWHSLFRPVGLAQIGQMILMGLATIVGSMVIGYALSQLIAVTPNARIAEMSAQSWTGMIVQLLPTVPQLIGEEVITILPFLALLWLCFSRLGLSRTASIIIALIGSSLFFGALHLPTYDWNLGQSFGIIGGARVVLTLAYIWSKNLWVSAGAHIANDWTETAIAHLVANA